MLANKRTVFVGNIPFDVNEDRVKDMFKLVGPVKNFRLVVDRDSGLPKGFGFCEYHEEVHARTAINSLDQQLIIGRRIKVDSAEGSNSAEDDDDDTNSFRVSAEAKKQIEAALKKMPVLEVYEMVSEMKELIKTDRDYALQLLNEKPVLAQALVSAQLMLGLLEISAAVTTQSRGPSAENNSDNNVDTDLIQQVIMLTDEQIDALSPEEREKVLDIRHQILSQNNQ